MEGYTNQQRLEFIKLFYENKRDLTAAMCKIRLVLPNSQAPSEIAVRDLITKFEKTGTLFDDKQAGRTNDENEPGTSNRQRSQQFNNDSGDLNLNKY